MGLSIVVSVHADLARRLAARQHLVPHSLAWRVAMAGHLSDFGPFHDSIFVAAVSRRETKQSTTRRRRGRRFRRAVDLHVLPGHAEFRRNEFVAPLDGRSDDAWFGRPLVYFVPVAFSAPTTSAGP